MTLDEFVEELTIVRHRWHWGVQGPHRHLRGHDAKASPYCPLTAVANVTNPLCWGVATYMLGLSMADGEAIMRAADRHGDHDRALRARLLAACGVEEVSL